MSSTIKGVTQVRDHFARNSETPVAVFFQRITDLIGQIKLKLIQVEEDVEIEVNEATSGRYGVFRNELINAIQNNHSLLESIASPTANLFLREFIQISCESIEKNLHFTNESKDTTIDFLVQWLNLIDDQDEKAFKVASNPGLWRFANACAFLEYDVSILFSFYATCRINDNLGSNQQLYASFSKNPCTRSKTREKLILSMFHRLWANLVRLAKYPSDDQETWLRNYNLVTKYFTLKQLSLCPEAAYVKDRVEFMDLAYLMLLGKEEPGLIGLIQRLLTLTQLDEQRTYGQQDICLKKLAPMIEEIYKYCRENQLFDSKLMIDAHAWTLRVLRSSKNSSTNQVTALFRFINQATHHLPLSIKQFLFDELSNIQLQNINLDPLPTSTTITSFWDRISLLPTLINCLPETTLDHYHLPYHPSVINDPNQHQILLDLFFFYLRRLSNEEPIRVSVVQKILMSRLPPGTSGQKIGMGEKVFGQLKDYFLLQTTATLLCEMHTNNRDQEMLDPIVKTIIEQYLTIEFQAKQLSKNLKLFLSIIISKKSREYLNDLLKSELLQRLDGTWATTLYQLLHNDSTDEKKKLIQLCHQIDFTVHIDNSTSVFPGLNKPYQQLKQLIQQCTENMNIDERWKPLIQWIKSKVALNRLLAHRALLEIKVMLLLNIYYNYYCSNQLDLLAGFSAMVQNHLQPSEQELTIFRAFLQPKEFMIGYTDQNDDPDKNFLNDLFHLDFHDEDELPVRHVLVNLLAMILLSGKESFLWPFAFEPTKLIETFGFGSLRSEPISSIVHYDCGCFLTETGALVFPPVGRGKGSLLNVPAVYAAYFATFGAIAWHLLLHKNGPETFYGPILAKHAIDSRNPNEGMNGITLRARVCHFVRARIVSTNFFLAQRFNQDEACILLTLCFEQLALLSRQPNQNPWIKSVFKTHEERYEAEKGFQDQIFYPMLKKVPVHVEFLSSLDLQSAIQKNLQEYISRLPITIGFEQFKTELCNPTYERVPLKLLKHVLNSLDQLRMTQYIYDLSQFHLLLHRTFSHFIERDEFYLITLHELYERSKNYFARLRQPQESEKHRVIIEKGIEAVNMYHQFTDGLIQPGACKDAQRFDPISMDTCVNYLMETENFDQGDLIMRILSTLVSFHNRLVNLLENELSEIPGMVDSSALKKIGADLSKREVCIVQVAQERTGVITLIQTDRQWIEKLAQASVQNEDNYFLRRETPISFDYLYIQSYLIRTYLLYHRISCENIRGKYEYLVKPKGPEVDPSMLAEWSHLEQMSLDRLQKELEFLENVSGTLTVSNNIDLQKIQLSEYLRRSANQSQLFKQYEEYDMKDFPLGSIGIICHLYKKAIQDCSFPVNIIAGIRVPLSQELQTQLDKNLETSVLSGTDNLELNELEERMSHVSEFIKSLKESHSLFSGQRSQSFRDTCEVLCFDEECYKLIPDGVIGENYGPICERFIDIRSQLYEGKMKIKQRRKREMETNQNQTPSNGIPQQILQNNYLERSTSYSLLSPVSLQNRMDAQKFTSDISEWQLCNSHKGTVELHRLTNLHIDVESSKQSELFIKTVGKSQEMRSRKSEGRCTIHLPDGSQIRICIEQTKLHEKIRDIFKSKGYGRNHLVVVDADFFFLDVFEDFNSQRMVKEYHVIDKASLIVVNINFGPMQAKYYVAKQAELSSIISRFWLENLSRIPTANEYCHFSDEYGRLLDKDIPIHKLCQENNEAPIRLYILSRASKDDVICKITVNLRTGQPITEYFSPLATGRKINRWLKAWQLVQSELESSNCSWWREKSRSFTEHDSLASALLRSMALHLEINNEIEGRKAEGFATSKHSSLFTRTWARGILTNNSMRQGLENCTRMKQQVSYFRIWIFNDPSSVEDICVKESLQNYTVKQLLKRIKVKSAQQYLATTSTKMILDERSLLADVADDEFYLVEHFETCLISINLPNNGGLHSNNAVATQRYIIDATIADVCAQNRIVDPNYCIQCDGDFVPSLKTSLSFLTDNPSIPADLVVIKTQSLVNVTVVWDDSISSTKFRCLPSLSLGRVRKITCRLWKLPGNYCCLRLRNRYEPNYDISVSQTFPNVNDIKITAIVFNENKCVISYHDQQILIPIAQDTAASTLLKDAMARFYIPAEDASSWKLYLMDNPDVPTELDPDVLVTKTYGYLPKETKTIPLRLSRTRCSSQDQRF